MQIGYPVNMAIKIELVPTLDHCIETAAKREFLKAEAEYMQSNKEDKNLEEKIELLRMFIDTANFRELRAESEKYLTEGKVVKFLLSLDNGKLSYTMKVSRRFEIDNIIYGPVSSWRLGRSLGIDLLATRGKTCSFDCIYCEWGKTVNSLTQRQEFVTLEELGVALQKAKGSFADYATFAGNGEPTLARNLGNAIDMVKSELRLPIAVLTNSSLMTSSEVRSELARADFVVAKLDAPNDSVFQIMNKPAAGLSLNDIIQGVQEFRREYRGKLALQMMFLDINKGWAKELAGIAEKLSPDEVQINTPLRPCNVRPLSSAELAAIRAAFNRFKRVVTVYEAVKPLE